MQNVPSRFLQLGPRQVGLLSLAGKEQVAHSAVVWVLQDDTDHLHLRGDAGSPSALACTLDRVDGQVGFLVWVDGKRSFACAGQQLVRTPELNGVSSLRAFQVLGHLPSVGKLGMGVFEISLDDQVHEAFVIITGDGCAAE